MGELHKSRSLGRLRNLYGEVAERSKAAVLKTVEGFPLPEFESLPLRQRSRDNLCLSKI